MCNINRNIIIDFREIRKILEKLIWEYLIIYTVVYTGIMYEYWIYLHKLLINKKCILYMYNTIQKGGIQKNSEHELKCRKLLCLVL